MVIDLEKLSKVVEALERMDIEEIDRIKKRRTLLSTQRTKCSRQKMWRKSLVHLLMR